MAKGISEKLKFVRQRKFLKWNSIRWVWAAVSLALLVWTWEDAAEDPVYAVVGVILIPPAVAAVFVMIGLVFAFVGGIVLFVVSEVYKFFRDLMKIVKEYRER